MNEFLRLVLNLGIVAKAVLLILLVLSIISWAIIIERGRLFRKIKKESKRFWHLLKLKPQWSDLYVYSREFRYSPYPNMVKRVHQESRNSENSPNENDEMIGVGESKPVMMRKKLQNINVALNASHEEEISRLEQHMILLSTTVSVSPFLGLLGTVWGIMHAFMNIGITGSANIASVGPGIAEALITTVAGLAVAIPALMAYNYFVDQIRRIDGKLEVFSADLTRILDRENY